MSKKSDGIFHDLIGLIDVIFLVLMVLNESVFNRILKHFPLSSNHSSLKYSTSPAALLKGGISSYIACDEHSFHGVIHYYASNVYQRQNLKKNCARWPSFKH